MFFDPDLIDEDLVGVVEDVDRVAAHDELGSLLLLEQQSLVVVPLSRGPLLFLGINLLGKKTLLAFCTNWSF